MKNSPMKACFVVHVKELFGLRSFLKDMEKSFESKCSKRTYEKNHTIWTLNLLYELKMHISSEVFLCLKFGINILIIENSSRLSNQIHAKFKPNLAVVVDCLVCTVYTTKNSSAISTTN